MTGNLVRLEQGLGVRLVQPRQPRRHQRRPRPRPGGRDRADRVVQASGAGQGRVSRADVDAAIRMMDADSDPSPAACRTCRPYAYPPRRRRPAQPWPVHLHGHAGPARDGVRHRTRRHGQDLPGRRPGRRHAASRPRGPHRAVPPRRRGRGAAGLSARRLEGEGGPLSPPPVRRLERHDARRPGDPPHGARGRSRSPRWPSCAGAPWPMPS